MNTENNTPYIDNTLASLLDAYFFVAEACAQDPDTLVMVCDSDGQYSLLPAWEAKNYYEIYFLRLPGSLIAKALCSSVLH